jgi:hypothetical protein
MASQGRTCYPCTERRKVVAGGSDDELELDTRQAQAESEGDATAAGAVGYECLHCANYGT